MTPGLLLRADVPRVRTLALSSPQGLHGAYSPSTKRGAIRNDMARRLRFLRMILGSRAEVVINMIQNTATKDGKRVAATLDTNKYPAGQKPCPEEMAGLEMAQSTVHREWNYVTAPGKVWDRREAQHRKKGVG